jgi:chromate transport protein ChrA
LVLNLVSAIYVPSFNETPYLGQGSPNPWHNPTTIMVRPIALLVFVIVIGECVRVQRGGFRKGQGLRVWKGILIAVLLLLSNLSKPSFVQIFYPAIFLLMFLWLFIYRFRNFPLGMQLLVCCLPSVALMAMQFLTAFYGSTNEDSAGVVFAPFKVAGLYTPNIAVSTLLLLAFPLCVSLCGIVRRTFDWTDFFAWITLFVGMGEKFLLAEGGSRMYHGNFNWGYILGAYLLWFISIRDYAAWRCCFADGRGFKKAVAVLAFALCGIVLLLHLASGIYYLYYLVVLGNGI